MAKTASHRVEVTINSLRAMRDGQPLLLDVPARLVDDRTFLPLRFTAEALGASVAWDPSTWTVIITSAPEEPTSLTWEPAAGPPGGGISVIAVDPVRPEILYAGTPEGGGMYRSTDRGEHWYPAFSAHTCFVTSIAPTAQAVYAGTDCGAFYRSVDHGQTWQEVKMNEETRVRKVVFSPHGENAAGLLLAGTQDHRVLISRDGGAVWENVTGDLPADRISSLTAAGPREYWVGYRNWRNGGLYHTTDGGKHWQKATLPQPPDTDVFTVLVAPDDPQTVYVALGNVHNEGRPRGHDYLFKTTDGGKTWQPIRYPFDPDSGWWWFLAQGAEGSVYLSQGFRIWRSTDQGETWRRLWFTGIPEGMAIGDVGTMAIDPADPATLYLPTSGGVAKSADFGQSWVLKNQGILQTRINLLAAHPTNPATLYAASAGGEGTFRSTDYGRHWTWLNGGGIEHPYPDELVVNPVNPRTLYEAVDVSDVYRSNDGGDTWNQAWPEFQASSIYALASAPSDPGVLYALKNGFGIFKSDNGGEGWRFLHQSQVDYTYTLAVHPRDPQIIYSGYNPKPFQDWAMVRRSADGGATWRTVLEVPHAGGITAVAIDPANPDTVYAGSTGEGGIVWVSRDSGETWAKLNEQLTFTNVHALTVDPNNPEVAYAGVWGGGTFRTGDGGQTWDRLPNDPTISATAILINPRNSDTIYLADRTGPRVYRTTDGGKHWETYFDAGPAYYRVLAATPDPGNPDILYVSIFSRHGGPMAGGLFRLEKGVAVRVTANLPRLPVAVAVDPHDQARLYAVTHANGLYGSTDAGKSWVELSDSDSGLPQAESLGFGGLIMDPQDSRTLYLIGGGDFDHNLRHTGIDPAIMHTVYKSVDGGQTWVNLNDGSLGGNSGQIKGFTIDPNDRNTLYAGGVKGVFMSRDGGRSWTNITAGLSYTATAGAVISGDGRRLYVPTLGGGVYVGALGSHGVSWAQSSTLKAQIYHVQVVVDPSDSRTVYATAYPGGIFKTTDGGRAWAEGNFGMASFKIDDPSRQGYYALAVSPSERNILYLGLYGVGIYKSEDGTESWRPVNGANDTMRGKPVTALAVDPSDANRIVVATENGIYRTRDGGATWDDFSQGLLSTDIRTLMLAADGTLYAGSKGYGIFRRGGHDAAWRQMPALREFGTFWPIWDGRPLYQYTSLLIHPADSQTIYLGTFPAGIYKTTDGGKTWRERNVGWTNDGVFTLVSDPLNPEIVYAGTYNGINRSTDGGGHWELWDQGWPPEQWVFAIAFDPTDPNVMYAVSKNGENMGRGRPGFHGTVMKSTDGGAHWFPITTGLNINQEFYRIIVNPHYPDTLYLATESDGVFISRDAGGHWKAWNDGLGKLTAGPNGNQISIGNLRAGTNGNNVTNVLTLSADGKVIYFGTHGAGVWRRRLEE